MTTPETTTEARGPSEGSSLDESAAAAPTGQRPLRRRLRRVPWHLIVFIGPALLVYATFMVYPLFDTLRLSFFSDTGKYVGVTNFHTLLTDSNYAPAFWN